MTVILQEIHHVPLVSFQAYVKVGSIHEGKYLGSGISHFLEHVIDGGTRQRNRTEVDDIVEAVGNYSNAYTTKDHTLYYITAPTHAVDLALDVLSDYIIHPIFPPIEVEIQRNVIYNELNGDLDDPIQLLHNTFYQTAFRKHPVRFPVGGSAELLAALTRENLVEFYRQHYAANNLIFVATGDFSASEMLDKISSAFEKLPKRRLPTIELPSEPPQLTPRRAERTMGIEMAYLGMGYHTVDVNHADALPLDVISTLLGSGESSRLIKNLKHQQQIAYSVDVCSETPHYDAGFLSVEMEVESENLERAETSLIEQMERLKSEPVSDSELYRARTIDESEYLFTLQTVEERGTIFGIDELTTGDYDYHGKYLQKLHAVTPDDIQRAAQTYLRKEHLTTVVIRPDMGKPSIVTADVVDTDFTSDLEAARTVQNSAPAVIGELQDSDTTIDSEARDSTPQKDTLPNGLCLLTKSLVSTPVVSIQALFFGGTRFETEVDNGVFHLMSHLLLKGTTSRSSDEVFESVEARGGSISAFSGHQAFGIGLNLLSRDLEYGLELLADILLNPAFDENELRKLKEETIVSIQSEEDDWYALGKQQFLETMFHEHPNRLRACGSITSLTELSKAEIWNCYHRYCRSNNMVLGVYGDLRPPSVKRIVQRHFADFPSSNLSFPKVPSEPPLRCIRNVERCKELAQAVIFQGFRCVPLQHSDREIVEVLSCLLFGAGHPGGRIYKRLRREQLVYYTHGNPYFGLDYGFISICASTMPKNIESVLEQINDEILSLRQTRVSDEELDRGKQMCITTHLISMQTAADQASADLLDELHGLGFNNSATYASRIAKVTASAIQRVATKYLDLNKRVISIVKP